MAAVSKHDVLPASIANGIDALSSLSKHRGPTFAHARVFVRAEEKYISERLHKALEKRVNKITRG